MKREIKFRGKRIDNGEWVYGDLIHGVGSKAGRMYILPRTHIYPKGCSELDGWNVDPKTVGQLVKRINGVEFFTGNIGRTNDEAKLIIILVWIEQYGMYSWLTQDEYKQLETGDLNFDEIMFWTYAFEDRYANDIEIIGNIHDNPELL